MYPFKEGNSYARNQWYVAGWSSEVTREAMLERWILGEPVLFYRTEDGRAVAVEGRCPHRNYPLAKGKLVGDDVQCGYHGITFASTGECVRIPSQVNIPTSCRLRSYPLVEKGMLLWIWTGSPADADRARIPDYAELRLDKEGWLATQGFSVSLNARYQLLNENLLDLSHLTFLHPGTVGTDALAATEVSITDGERFLRGTRKMKNDHVTGFFAKVLSYEGAIDRETLIDFYPPGLHVAWEFFMKPGTLETLDTDHPEDNPNVLGMFRVHHMVTPATRDKTHYLVAYSRTSARDDASVTETMTNVFRHVINQDVEASEAIEAILKTRETAPTEVLVKADAHAMRGRRRLEALIDRERDASAHA